MHLAVTVGAASVEGKNRWTHGRRKRFQRPRRSWMARMDMTLSTKPRVGDFQQTIVDGTMRLVAVITPFQNRRMLPQKRTAALRVAGVAIFIDTRLHELRWVGTTVRIVTIGADHLPLSHRHMRGAHELGFTLEMALTANFDLGAIDPVWSYLSLFGQLLAAGLLHQRVTADTGQTAAGVRACLPESLNAPLMAAEARLVLYFGGFAGVFAESDHPADPFAAASRDMLASGTMAILARPFFRLVARVVQEYLAHQGCREFFELGRVASLTNLIADISGRSGFRRIGCCGPNP